MKLKLQQNHINTKRYKRLRIQIKVARYEKIRKAKNVDKKNKRQNRSKTRKTLNKHNQNKTRQISYLFLHQNLPSTNHFCYWNYVICYVSFCYKSNCFLWVIWGNFYSILLDFSHEITSFYEFLFSGFIHV